MYILGINQTGYISSACLLKDNKIVSAIAEERITRNKKTRTFPHKSIQYCLDKEKKTITDVDYVAFGWNPAVNITKLNKGFSNIEKQRYMGEYLYSSPSHMLQYFKDKDTSKTVVKLQLKDKNLKMYNIKHHDSHLANAYLTSKFNKSAIFSADGFGERETVVFAMGEQNKIQRLKTQSFPHSVGMFYSAFTQFLGFRPDSDEWKVMAMSSYAKPTKYYSRVKNLVKLLPNGEFQLDLNYFEHYDFDTNNMFNQNFIKLFGEPRNKEDKITVRHYEIASAMQNVSEEIVIHCLNWLYKKTKCQRLCLSGGFFMNSVINGKIQKLTKFKDVYVSSCPDDSGNSIGAAVYLYNHVLNNKKRVELKHNFFGTSFEDKEIKTILDKYLIKYRKVTNPAKCIAELVSLGNIVGLFNGSMEFGQRALGHRSILADPRKKEMKDKINSAIKFRESFRPFAPSVIEEEAWKYFDIKPNQKVPFMEKVVQIRKPFIDKIPAVCHIDNSARIQTVDKTNKMYHNILLNFKKLTGIPIMLNTSFNLNGEPIVSTVKDALRTFYTSGMNYLIIGKYIISKK